MSKTIQIPNVPDHLYHELDRRAKAAGRTLADYVAMVLERDAAQHAAEEVFERVARRSSVDLGRPTADLLHDERAARSRP